MVRLQVLEGGLTFKADKKVNRKLPVSHGQLRFGE